MNKLLGLGLALLVLFAVWAYAAQTALLEPMTPGMVRIAQEATPTPRPPGAPGGCGGLGC